MQTWEGDFRQWGQHVQRSWGCRQLFCCVHGSEGGPGQVVRGEQRWCMRDEGEIQAQDPKGEFGRTWI